MSWRYWLLPWRRRAEKAHLEAERAKAVYHATVSQRPEVEAVARELRRQRELNGWTDRIITLFTQEHPQ